MKKTKKKGFTVVELVIVIAVIAILAAILIPTFVSLVRKADTAADIQTVRNLNMIIVAEGADKGGIKTAHDAIIAASENGYDVTHVTPTEDGRTIVWDGGNSRFALLDEEGKEVYPKDDKTGTPKANLFVVSNTYPADGFNGYGVYLTKDCTLTEIEATTGVDVGYNTEIVKVTYSGTDEVIIRTDAELCNFNMTSGTVNHYGVALNAVVSGGTYNCFATLMDGQYASADEVTELFAGGLGTEERPYLIATSEQFANIGNEELQKEMREGTAYHYVLLSDVTITDQYNWFNGVLDGKGHSIDLDIDGAQYLFAAAIGKTTFKNLTVVQSAEDLTALVYSTNYDPYTGESIDYYTPVSFENITAVSSGEVQHSASKGRSSFVFFGHGTMYFINCVNEVDFNATEYTGIFAGNTQLAVRMYFDSCVNRGNVTGTHIGFFKGNPTGWPLKGVTNDKSIFESNVYYYYINNCSNEGVIMGLSTAMAFSTLGYNTHTEEIQANAGLTPEMFDAGMMFTASGDVGLSLENGRLSVFDNTSNASVIEYEVSYSIFTSSSRGTSYIQISEVITLGEQLDYVIKVITDSEYGKAEYANLAKNGELTDRNGHKYILVDTDGGKMMIVNTEELPPAYSVSNNDGSNEEIDFKVNTQAEYSIFAKTSAGVVDGAMYDKGELE